MVDRRRLQFGKKSTIHNTWAPMAMTTRVCFRASRDAMRQTARSVQGSRRAGHMRSPCVLTQQQSGLSGGRSVVNTLATKPRRLVTIKSKNPPLNSPLLSKSDCKAFRRIASANRHPFVTRQFSLLAINLARLGFDLLVQEGEDDDDGT